MGLFSKSIVDKCSTVFDELDALEEADRIEAINEIRLALHLRSPFVNEPVDCVLWVPFDSVQANDYNPNSVAPPEMKLLAHSIIEDGYTQPIVTWKSQSQMNEVIDGYHRNRVGWEVPEVRERVRGYLPITVVNGARTDRGDRIAATIRHNRARGKHRIDAMSDIVVELKRRNWSDEKIGRELGMDPDEVLRLTQITGLAEMFADREFSAAWEAAESSEINEEDNLSVIEENFSGENPEGPSPLSEVGGLAGGDVPGDSAGAPASGNRCGGKASANAGPVVAGDEGGDKKVAKRGGSKSKQHGKEPPGMAGSSGVLSSHGDAGLPYETGMAQSQRKPAKPSKRRSRRRD